MRHSYKMLVDLIITSVTQALLMIKYCGQRTGQLMLSQCSFRTSDDKGCAVLARAVASCEVGNKEVTPRIIEFIERQQRTRREFAACSATIFSMRQQIIQHALGDFIVRSLLMDSSPLVTITATKSQIATNDACDSAVAVKDFVMSPAYIDHHSSKCALSLDV
eukprot:scaffold403078_cov18-Prasinocladus_malaysianus.AAC.1